MKRIVVLCALAVVGCSQDPDQNRDDPAKSPVATVPSSSSDSQVPDYPGSSRVEVPNFGVNGKDSRSGNAIAMETDASPAEVAKFYRDWFNSNGIPIRSDGLTDDGGLLAASRDGEKGVMLTVSRTQNRTRIGIVRARGGL